MEDDAPAKDDGGEDIGVIVLMLGLYLIVLAFFILLNAISEDSPEKRDLVVESVMEGFSFKNEGGLVGDGLDEVAAIPLYRVTENAIEGVIETYLSFDEYEVSKSGERLFVTMELERFFRQNEIKLIPEMILFFEDLGAILSAPKKGLKIIGEILVKGDHSDVAPNFTGLSTAGERATLFTRALTEQGVIPAHMSAAALTGRPQIVMIFDVIVTNFDDAREASAALQDALKPKTDGAETPEDEPTETQEP